MLRDGLTWALLHVQHGLLFRGRLSCIIHIQGDDEVFPYLQPFSPAHLYRHLRVYLVARIPIYKDYPFSQAVYHFDLDCEF